MGFDIERIPNIQSLPGEYFCPVCQLLIDPNEALQSMCSHLYCKPCLAYVARTTMACPYDGYLVTETDAKPLVESNKMLAYTIGKTVVHCLYQNNGCTWLGSLSESSSHCSGCAFGSSLVVCNWCGIQIEHRQGQEHVQVCHGLQQVQVQESQGSQPVAASDQVQAYIQATAVVATSQTSTQGHGVAATTLTQEQWYQQQYQQYYQNYSGFYMYQQQVPMSNSQQQLHFPGLASQKASLHQVPYVQPKVQNMAQTHSQVQAQPHLQSQSLPLHQPHALFPSAPHLGAASLPQTYPLVPPHSQDPSQTFSASQGLQDLQAYAHSQTTFLSQAHHLQNLQVPDQYQPFHGLVNSQCHIQNPIHPQANNVQESLSQDTIGQGQSHQPHAYWNGQKLYPEPNQTNQVGIQPSQVQNHFPQQVPHVHPPHSLPTMQTQHPSLPSPLTRNQYVRQLVLKYGRAPVSESSVMQPEHQHTAAPTTDVVEGNEIKSGLLGKQGMEENVGKGQENLGKILVEQKKGTEDDPSLNGTPLNPTSLESDGLNSLKIILKHYLSTFHVDSDDVQRSGAYSSGSLDRGIDQRSPVRPYEKHEPHFDLRPTSRLSQPLIDLGEPQLRRGPRSPTSEHLRMPSYGSDMIGQVDVANHIRGDSEEGIDFDSNALRPGDVGFRSRFTLQGFPSDAC